MQTKKKAPARRPADGDGVTSDPAAVDAWMKDLDHPLKPVLQAVRNALLDVDASIGEQIKWGHPTFVFTGPTKPFAAKTYKRVLVVTNLRSKEGGVLLVLLQGARVKDPAGLLTGDYADGRRLVRFHTVAEVKAAKAPLAAIVRELIAIAGA